MKGHTGKQENEGNNTTVAGTAEPSNRASSGLRPLPPLKHTFGSLMCWIFDLLDIRCLDIRSLDNLLWVNPPRVNPRMPSRQ